MLMIDRCTSGHQERGFTMIEVLVTMVILLIGLLGVLGLQVRATKVEFESYQRGQALSLVRDMESRIAAAAGLEADNTTRVYGSFLTDTLSSTSGALYFGAGSAIDCTAPDTVAKTEVCAWDQALKGAAMKEGGANVAAMVGARGCLIRVVPAQDNAHADFFIVVVWQGVVAGAEPLDGSPAGKSNCASAVDYGAGLRRGISTRVLVPHLTKQI